MMRNFLRAKIHKAVVTEANLDYVGSITIDSELMRLVDILPNERVMVVSNTSGARLETYVIPGAAMSGCICMNGAAAHLVREGEEIIIMSFEWAEKAPEPKVILVDPRNRLQQRLDEKANDVVPAKA